MEKTSSVTHSQQYNDTVAMYMYTHRHSVQATSNALISVIMGRLESIPYTNRTIQYTEKIAKQYHVGTFQIFSKLTDHTTS